MTRKQFRYLKSLLIVLVLLLLGKVGFTAGKYFTTVPIEGNVSFHANLVSSGTGFYMRENTPVRKADGSYELSGNYLMNGAGMYSVMPGVDIPKNPHISIAGKTPIPAYLFLVVQSDMADSGITFTLQSCWKPIQAGSHVYVYSDNSGNPIVIDNTTAGLNKIMILQEDERGNTIFVSENLQKGIKFNLNFTAILKEVYQVTMDGEKQWAAPAAIYGISN